MFKQVLILDSSIKKCVLFHAPDGHSKQTWKSRCRSFTSGWATAYHGRRDGGMWGFVTAEWSTTLCWAHSSIPKLKVLHSLDLLEYHLVMIFFLLKVHVLFQVPWLWYRQEDTKAVGNQPSTDKVMKRGCSFVIKYLSALSSCLDLNRRWM